MKIYTIEKSVNFTGCYNTIRGVGYPLSCIYWAGPITYTLGGWALTA